MQPSFTSEDGREGWTSPPTEEDVQDEKRKQDAANDYMRKQIEEKERNLASAAPTESTPRPGSIEDRIARARAKLT